MGVAFRAARWGKGGDDYINCPLDREQYERLVDAILAAEKMPLKSFERCVHFEGCMPVEEIARRGRDTLAFGPMRPVGLTDPRTGRRAHAVVQLRQDDLEGRLWSLVGFQTKMTYPEQRRVFRMIPGLEKAEFVRLGSLHRNTFIHSPTLLRPTLQFLHRDDLFFAGQLIGVEGYVDPVIWWPRGGNPGNLIVYRGDLFPAWQGNVLIATMSNRALGPGLVRAVIGDNGALVHEERMLTEIGNRMRDVVEAPDGRIFVLTETSAFASPGAILVLEPGGVGGVKEPGVSADAADRLLDGLQLLHAGQQGLGRGAPRPVDGPAVASGESIGPLAALLEGRLDPRVVMGRKEVRQVPGDPRRAAPLSRHGTPPRPHRSL